MELFFSYNFQQNCVSLFSTLKHCSLYVPRDFWDREGKAKPYQKKDAADTQRKTEEAHEWELTNSAWPIHTRVVIPIYYMMDDLVHSTFLVAIPTAIYRFLLHQISNIFLPLFVEKNFWWTLCEKSPPCFCRSLACFLYRQCLPS